MSQAAGLHETRRLRRPKPDIIATLRLRTGQRRDATRALTEVAAKSDGPAVPLLRTASGRFPMPVTLHDRKAKVVPDQAMDMVPSDPSHASPDFSRPQHSWAGGSCADCLQRQPERGGIGTVVDTQPFTRSEDQFQRRFLRVRHGRRSLCCHQSEPGPGLARPACSATHKRSDHSGRGRGRMPGPFFRPLPVPRSASPSSCLDLRHDPTMGPGRTAFKCGSPGAYLVRQIGTPPPHADQSLSRFSLLIYKYRAEGVIHARRRAFQLCAVGGEGGEVTHCREESGGPRFRDRHLQFWKLKRIERFRFLQEGTPKPSLPHHPGFDDNHPSGR